MNLDLENAALTMFVPGVWWGRGGGVVESACANFNF